MCVCAFEETRGVQSADCVKGAEECVTVNWCCRIVLAVQGG